MNLSVLEGTSSLTWENPQNLMKIELNPLNVFYVKGKTEDITKCSCFGKFFPWFVPKALGNDDVVFVVSHKDKKIASCHKKLLNTEFAWDKNCVSPAAIVSGVPCLIRKEMVRVSHCDEEWKGCRTIV